MAGTSLAIVERELTAHLPTLAQALPRTGSLAPERLMRTAIMAAERNPDILNCAMESIVSSTVTAAVIGLEVDGVTGQGFLVPFNDRRRGKLCQFMLGYKGYPTIAARSNLSISSGVVRDGDAFDFDVGEGWVKHKKAGDPAKPIIWAWAKLAGPGRAPVVKVMSRKEIDVLRNRSKAAASGFSPWSDESGPGFAAMAEKSAIRQIGRNMPVIAADASFHRAAELEGVQEGGNLAWLKPDGALQIERVQQAEPMSVAEVRPDEFRWTMGDGTDRVWKSAAAWAMMLAQNLDTLSDDALQKALDRNIANLASVRDRGFVDQHMAVMRVFVARSIFPSSQRDAGEVIDQ